MQFLTPLFWLGALAVAVPVLLHLTRREVKNPVPFASLMFLRRLPFQETRRRKLRHLLLLLLRCLGLVLLAAAFAHPVLTNPWLIQADPSRARSVVVLVDHSLSMSRSPVWEDAVAAATEKLRSLSSEDEAMLIQFAATAEALTTWQSNPSQLVETALARLQPGYEATSYDRGLSLAADQFENARNLAQEIYLITDLQGSGLDLQNRQDLPAEVLIEIEDVGDEAANLFIDEVRVQRAVYGDQYPHSILVRLASNPPEEVAGEALLYIGDELLQRKPFELGESGSATVTFNPFEIPEGPGRGRIVLTVEDSLPEDNTYYFVAERSAPSTVALVAEPGTPSALFFENALSSGNNLPYTVRRTTRLTAARLQEDAVVILADLKRPPSGTALVDFVNAGGGLLVTAGSAIDADSYNSRLGSLLPGRLLERQYSRTSRSPFVAITDVEWEHPIFQVFQADLRSSISDVQVYGYWQLEASPDSRVLARYANGDPAVVERRLGDGKIILVTTSFDRVWSDFPLRSAFVPFCQQTLDYIARLQARPAAYQVSQVVSVDEWAGSDGGPRKWDVLDPKGKRVLALGEESPNFVQLRIPGHYEIRVNKGTDWIGVNTSSEESDLTRLKKEELMAAIGSSKMRRQDVNVTAEASVPASARSIWWAVLMAAALIFAVESAVANRLGRQKIVQTRVRPT